MRLAALQSVIEHQGSKHIGLPAPTLNSLFPVARRSFLDDVPHLLAKMGSSSPELHPSSECVLIVTCLARVPSTSQGSIPLRDNSNWSPPTASFHTRLSFALSVSHALDDLLLQMPCGLISSHSHVRDSHFRGFPRCQADLPHRQALLSCRSLSLPTSELPHQRQRPPLRLQSFDPGSDPLRPTGGLDLLTTRSPLGLSTPSGSSPSTLGAPSRPLRL